jgi:signal transduction histidine kinase
MERALQLEKDRSGLLSEFIQDASHEFRTPLTLIQMSLDGLGRISPEEKQQKYIQRIKQQSDAILKLVDDLIYLARLDNISSLELEPIVLNNLIKAAVGQVEGMIEAKNIQFTLELPDQPLRILGDRVELANALAELIRNACNYSNPDSLLTVTLDRDDLTAVITIRDTGIGMTDEQVSRMFERFYRANEAHTTRGFGLGLPIVSRIIDLHHGEISVASEIGQGTTIMIGLPLNDD